MSRAWFAEIRSIVCVVGLLMLAIAPAEGPEKVLRMG
jgi:hypothetical protein